MVLDEMNYTPWYPPGSEGRAELRRLEAALQSLQDRKATLPNVLLQPSNALLN